MLNINEISQAEQDNQKKQEQKKLQDLRDTYRDEEQAKTILDKTAKRAKRKEIEGQLKSMYWNGKGTQKKFDGNLSDLEKIISEDPDMQGKQPKLNEVSQDIERGSSGKLWTDTDTLELRRLIEDGYEVSMSRHRGDIDAAVNLYAEHHSYNPLTEYLNNAWNQYKRGLRGKYTIEDYWIKTLGVEDCKYTRTVSKYYFLAAARVAYRPGIENRHVPILTGKQRIGKSTSLKLLTPPKLRKLLYTDQGLDFKQGKDLDARMGRTWIVELSEGKELKSYSAEQMKAYITRYTYRYRPPYGRRDIIADRLATFVITTNNGGMNLLSDPSGNSRYDILNGNKDAIDPAYDVRHIKPEDITALWGQAVEELVEHPEYMMPAGLDYPEDIQEEQTRRNAASNFTPPAWDIYDTWLTDNISNFDRISARQLHTRATGKSWEEYDKKDQHAIGVFLENKTTEKGNPCFRRIQGRKTIDHPRDGEPARARDVYTITPAGRKYYTELLYSDTQVATDRRLKAVQQDPEYKKEFSRRQISIN